MTSPHDPPPADATPADPVLAEPTAADRSLEDIEDIRRRLGDRSAAARDTARNAHVPAMEELRLSGKA